MRTTTLESSAGPILFRFPNQADIWRMEGHVPLLSTPLDADPATMADRAESVLRSPGDMLALLARCDLLLIACAYEPQLTLDKLKPGGSLIDIELLSTEERIILAGKLWQLAGVTAEEAARISPLVETATDSSSSTPLELVTAEGPAS